MSEHWTCKNCGSDDPYSDKLGFIIITYEHAPEYTQAFCGTLCAGAWIKGALNRLGDRILRR